MRTALLALLLLVAAQPVAAGPLPEKPGAALAALQLPPCDYKPGYWTPEGSLSKPLAAGDWAAVERELEEFQASYERNYACERRSLWAFERGVGFTDEVPAQLDRWVAARPQSWTAYAVRGVFWAQKISARRGAPGQYLTDEQWQELRTWTERAMPDLERAIELHPRAIAAHAWLISTYRVWGATAEVEQAYRRAVGIDPLSVQVLMLTLTALQPSWGGQIEPVEAIVAAARAREKENPRIARIYGYPAAWRAQVLEWRRSPNKAERARIIALYTRALRFGEIGSLWHYRRAKNYQEVENWEAAAADAASGLEGDPKSEGFWSIRIWALSNLGRHEEALAAAREARKQVPDSVNLRWYEADVVVRMGRYDEAAALHRAALAEARFPYQRSAALGGIAEALMKAKRYAEAEPVLAEATEVDPKNVRNWHSLAETRWQLGKRAEAVPAYERFIALSEGNGWSEETRMRAQEKIDLMRAGAAPPAGPKR